MKYNNCFLYGLLSKQKLKELLHIKRSVYCKSSFINSKINVYVNSVGRIIEAPDDDIICIQHIIERALLQIGVPEYVFSGISGKGYRKLENLHKQYRNTYCIDISKFFYNISREKVYKFYLEILKTSSDVANILTNFSCINLKLKNFCGNEEIINRINSKTILYNHLMAGAPLSTLLSFYSNLNMFNEINSFSDNNNTLFSLYVDDLVFSSDFPITDEFKQNINSLVVKNGYSLALDKTRYFTVGEAKKIFN